MTLPLIRPDWPAPEHVHAAVTTRQGGVSPPPYDTLNLGEHVGDDLAAVAANRQRLAAALQLPQEPRWLKQVHGTLAVDVAQDGPGCEGDAAYTHESDRVCAVLTADCLPVLLCDRSGTAVAAVHAGWRGLLGGVIEQTVERMAPDGEVLAWLGPAIGPEAFEVGDEVREAFMNESGMATSAFKPSPAGRWLADIYALARLRLQRIGIHAIYGGGFCTYSDADRFFSYRRDGRTGRMASLIWIGENSHPG